MSPFELLMEDLEETLYGQGYVYLYDFSWALRGLKLGLTEPQIGELSLEAYREFTSRHRLRLVWLEWLAGLDEAVPADADTSLDFDLYTTGEVDSPMLVLVRATTEVATAD